MMVLLDIGALLLFVIAGLRSHDEAAVPAYFARNAIPLVASWLGFAALLGTYRRLGFASLWRTWLVAVPVALVVRSVWVGSPTGARFLVFFLVVMAFTGLFLLLGRGLMSLLTGRGYPEKRGA